MPVNPDAVGSVSEPATTSWSSKDALLYALGVGAGVDDLAFVTENSMNVSQAVLPTMVVTLADVSGVFGAIGTFNPAMLVHGSQRIELAGPLPVDGSVSTVAEITGVFDKGSGAVVEVTARSTDVATGELRFVNVMGAFIRGEGGWGGDRGASAETVSIPEREPDHAVADVTGPDQALIYRLSGDRNPLHSDPEFARLAGFDRPILHGLCTYGFAGRALLGALCGADPARFVSMDARFSAPVFPGESLTTRIWKLDDGVAVFRVHGGDDRIVVDRGRCEFRVD